jgi:hypothetical protein
MSIGYNTKIVTSSLDIALDVNNTKSYSGAGSTWYNLIDGNNTEATNNTWGNAAITFTIISIINVLGNDTSYAYQPISKWTGTTDAAFALYHFQNYLSNNYQNRFGWYANAGGVWQNISALTTNLTLGHHFIALQYNAATGGQMWLDGATYGGRVGSGQVGSSVANINISGGPDVIAGIHQVKCAYFYSRELSDSEMKQNFAALRGRFGL